MRPQAAQDRAVIRTATHARVHAARQQITARHTLERRILEVLARCYPEALSISLIHYGVHWKRRGTIPSMTPESRRRVEKAVLLMAILDEVVEGGVEQYRWKSPAGAPNPGATA